MFLRTLVVVLLLCLVKVVRFSKKYGETLDREEGGVTGPLVVR